MKFNTNKILAEWAYRVDDGQPDVTNVDHVNHLREVLYNFGLPHKFIVEYVSNIQEIDFSNQAAFTAYDAKHKMRSTTKVTIGGKTTTAGEAGSTEKEDDIVTKSDTKEKKATVENTIKKYIQQSPKTPEEQEAVDNKLSSRVTDDLDLITDDADKYMANSNKEGSGTRTATIEQVVHLKEFTAIRVDQNNKRKAFLDKTPTPTEEEKQLYDDLNPVHIHPDAKAAQREISDEQLGKAKQYLKDKLGEKKYKALMKKIADSGAWRGSGFKYTPEELEERSSEILRLYLKNGGRCAVTGKKMKLSEMEPDHRIPLSAGKGGDRKKELDSPRDNMDLMFGNVNQFKAGVEGNNLIHKARKELYRDEGGIRSRKAREDQFKNARRAALEKKYTDDFNNNTLSITQDDILNMDRDEIKYLVEAHNKSNGMVVGEPEYNDRIKLNTKQRVGRSGANRPSIKVEREHLFNELNKKGFNIPSSGEVNEQQVAVDEARQIIRVQTIKDEITILKYKIENERYSDSAINKIKVGDPDPEKATLITSDRAKATWKKKIAKLEAELNEDE